MKDYRYKESLIVDKMQGKSDLTWKEIQNLCEDNTCCNDTFVRRAQGIYEAYKSREQFFEDNELESNYATMGNDLSDNTESNDVNTYKTSNVDYSAIALLQLERDKLRTEKLEMNRWHREAAREEMFYENIIRAIKETPMPIREKRCIVNNNLQSKVLIIADQHYGVDITIKGLDGNIVNKYSPEIFEDRMWYLLDSVVNLCKKDNVQNIKVCSLGDSLDGLLRFSQLMKLRWGVIESAVHYAKFMAMWLDELSKSVNIEFYNTQGNHTEMRLLDGKKGQLERENLDVVIMAMISAYLENNQNVKIIENESGYIFTNVCGYNLFGYHGEDKNLEKSLKDFSTFYDVNIDYVMAGHLHHYQGEACGARKGTIRASSIIGTDDFATKLKRRSDSAAQLLTFEKDKGLVRIDNIVLN